MSEFAQPAPKEQPPVHAPEERTPTDGRRIERSGSLPNSTLSLILEAGGTPGAKLGALLLADPTFGLSNAALNTLMVDQSQGGQSGMMVRLPVDPSGLSPDWANDPSHRDPNGSRWRHPSGEYLDFHRGRPGKPGFRGRDHWHHNGGDEHLIPGVDEIPEPVPVSAPRQPERVPQDANESGEEARETDSERSAEARDDGFMEKMAAITGLSGAALITYIIISEGSRAFPPRNLLPIP